MIDRIFYKNGEFNKMTIFWTGLLGIMLIRCFYFGITYFNYLDDYNTYGVFFRRNDDIWHNIIMWYRLYTFRPVAFFFDAYITQWFWPFMWILLLFYTVMHFMTAYLFYWICEKSNIKFGIFGILIVTITPILLEAVYWIGASTRLVPGMFFSILSVFFLVKYLLSSESIFVKSPGKGYLVLYLLFNLLSTGFYEQIVVFNLVFTLFIIAVNYNLLGRHDRLIVSVPFLSSLIIGVYYIIFWNHGKVQSRGALVGSSIISHFVQTTKGVANILLRANYRVSMDSLQGFLFINLSLLQFLGFVLVILFAVWICIVMLKKSPSLISRSDNKYVLRIVSGIVLTLAPFAPFYVLQNNFMSFRAVYPSIFGIAIFLDALLDLISEIKISKLNLFFIKPIITGFIIVPFFMSNIGWIHDYRLVEEADNIIMSNFLAAFSETGKSDEAPILLFNAQLLYADTATQIFENVSSSDWAMLGKANADSKDFYFSNILPVREGETAIHKNMFTDESVYLAIDENMAVFELYLINDILYIRENNLIYGRIFALNEEYSGFEMIITD